jgi:hypothetical protein
MDRREETMSDATNWSWWWARHPEDGYHGPHKTRQEAIDQGVADGQCEDEDGNHHIHICEACQAPVRLEKMFDADEWFDSIEDSLYELGNPDGDGVLGQLKKDDILRLQLAVREAIQAWHDDPENPVVIIPWAFSDQRNEEVAYVKKESTGPDFLEEMQR